MKDKWVRILGWSVFIAIAFVAVTMMSNEKFDSIRPLQDKTAHIIHEQELVPKEDVDLFIAGDEKLFVFFIDNELINVYDDTGSFLYGIQLPDGQNGVSDLAYQDGKLYVDNRGSGYYDFHGKDLLRFERGSVYNEARKELELLFTGEYAHTDGEATYLYVREENKFIRNINGCAEDFLQFPKRNKNVIPLLVLGFMVLSVTESCAQKKEV